MPKIERLSRMVSPDETSMEREQRVQWLKALVAAGCYPVNNETLAQAILSRAGRKNRTPTRPNRLD